MSNSPASGAANFRQPNRLPIAIARSAGGLNLHQASLRTDPKYLAPGATNFRQSNLPVQVDDEAPR
jgi:hypothetical protein